MILAVRARREVGPIGERAVQGSVGGDDGVADLHAFGCLHGEVQRGSSVGVEIVPRVVVVVPICAAAADGAAVEGNGCVGCTGCFIRDDEHAGAFGVVGGEETAVRSGDVLVGVHIDGIVGDSHDIRAGGFDIDPVALGVAAVHLLDVCGIALQHLNVELRLSHDVADVGVDQLPHTERTDAIGVIHAHEAAVAQEHLKVGLVAVDDLRAELAEVVGLLVGRCVFGEGDGLFRLGGEAGQPTGLGDVSTGLIDQPPCVVAVTFGNAVEISGHAGRVVLRSLVRLHRLGVEVVVLEEQGELCRRGRGDVQLHGVGDRDVLRYDVVGRRRGLVDLLIEHILFRVRRISIDVVQRSVLRLPRQEGEGSVVAAVAGVGIVCTGVDHAAGNGHDHLDMVVVRAEVLVLLVPGRSIDADNAEMDVVAAAAVDVLLHRQRQALTAKIDVIGLGRSVPAVAARGVAAGAQGGVEHVVIVHDRVAGRRRFVGCVKGAVGEPDLLVVVQLVPCAVDLDIVLLFAVDDGVIGRIVDVHGLALGIGKPADIVKLIFVDARGLVHLEDRVLIAVCAVVLVTADVEVDIRFDDIDEGQRQHPGIGGVAGVVLCAELIDICACLALDQALVHAAEHCFLKVLLPAPRRTAIGGHGVEVVLVGQRAVFHAEDLAVHQIVELIALAGLNFRSGIGHTVEQIGRCRILRAADGADAVFILMCASLLPRQKRIAAAAGILLEAAAERRCQRLQLLCGLRRGVLVANRGSAAEVIHIGDLIRTAHGCADRAAGRGCRDLAGRVGICQRRFLHDADQTAHERLFGRHITGVIDIGHSRLLGIAHQTADIGTGRRDPASVIAAGHRAGIELIAQAAKVLHTGNIALVAAVRHSRVDHGTGQTANGGCIADLFISGHIHAGNDLGKLRITGRADHACDISRINGEFACRVHAARDRQVLNDRMFFGRALDLTKQAEIQSLAGGRRGIVHRQVGDSMPCTVKATRESYAAIADRRPDHIGQIDILRQNGRDRILTAVDLLDKPDKLVGIADLIHAVLLRRLRRSLDRHSTLCLCLAAAGRDRGRTGLSGSHDAVLHGSDLCIRRRPGNGWIRRILRLDCSGQGRRVAGIQVQLGLIQRYSRGHDRGRDRNGTFCLHGAARCSDDSLAGRLRRNDPVFHRCDLFLRGAPDNGVRRVLRLDRGLQGSGLSRRQRQLRLVQRHAGRRSDLAGQLEIQLIRRARHGIHNAQIGDLAVFRRGEGLFVLVRQQGRLQLRSLQGEGIHARIVEIIALLVRHEQEARIRHMDRHITAVGQHGTVLRLALAANAGKGAGLSADADRERTGRDRNGTLGLHASACRRDDGAARADRSHNTVRDRSDRLIPGRPGQGIRGVFRLCRCRQNGSFARHQIQRGLVERHAGRRDDRSRLFKADCHIVIGEVGGLREAIAVIAGAGHIERDLQDLTKAGQVPPCPVHHDVLRTVAEVDAGRSGLLPCRVIARCDQLDPIVVADLGSQTVAVDVAVERIVRVVDIHMVNDTGGAVGKG